MAYATARDASTITAANTNATRKPGPAAMSPPAGPAARIPRSQQDVIAPIAVPAARPSTRSSVMRSLDAVKVQRVERPLQRHAQLPRVAPVPSVRGRLVAAKLASKCLTSLSMATAAARVTATPAAQALALIDALVPLSVDGTTGQRTGGKDQAQRSGPHAGSRGALSWPGQGWALMGAASQCVETRDKLGHMLAVLRVLIGERRH